MSGVREVGGVVGQKTQNLKIYQDLFKMQMVSFCPERDLNYETHVQKRNSGAKTLVSLSWIKTLRRKERRKVQK